MMKINLVILLVVTILLVVSETRQRKKKSLGGFDVDAFLSRVLEAKTFTVGELGETCKDVATWCTYYKQYCENSYVKKYCTNTCGLCPKPTVPPSDCKDSHPSCAKGVKYRYCIGSKEQVDFMKKYCQKSCNFCKPCTDKRGAAYCKSIKDGGYCNKASYKEYFQEKCQNSCGFCEDKTKEYTCGVAPQRKADKLTEIVGGKNAKKGSYPWQAAIYYNSVFHCGGTLINKRYILTAAHCFNKNSLNVKKYKIILGEHNRGANEDTEQTYYVNGIIIHENYRSDSDDHDIALMQLHRGVEYNNHIIPACLPRENEELRHDSKCYVTGWGKTYFDGNAVNILQELKVPVVDKLSCEKKNTFNFHKVTDRMICTGHNNGVDYSSGCHGDSGGPLSCERTKDSWTVYGVVSWGSPLCSGLDRYTVFTRVSTYIGWIEDNAV